LGCSPKVVHDEVARGWVDDKRRQACRSAGCYKLALSSNLKRAGAHRFYDSLGFERHGFSFVTRF